ncbi:MAG TPA: cohesin domain-containing protein, partial [Bacteroidota bacterium]|nr:cohesin domain-containing protein [Bacteroidota bacterium]
LEARAAGKGRYMLHVEGPGELVSVSGPIVSIKFMLLSTVLPDKHSAIEAGIVRLLDGDNHPILIASTAAGMVTTKSRQSAAHRLYVETGAAPSGDGSILHPFATIQEALSYAKDGDTVSVAAGMYLGPIVMKSNVHIAGAGAGVTTIVCPEEPSLSMAHVISFIRVKNSGISGCTLMNRAAMGTVIDVQKSVAEITMNRIDQSGASVNSVIVSDSSRVTFIDNYFTESTQGGAEMITLIASEVAIIRNVFSPVVTRDVIVLNNGACGVIANNRFMLSSSGMTGVTARASAGSVVANNVFKGPASAGSGVKATDAGSLSVVNNIFDVGQTGISCSGNGVVSINNVFIGCNIGLDADAGVLHRYNLYWRNAIPLRSASMDLTELTSDPQFVDTVKGSYQPKPGSCLIDAGDPSAIRLDRDGTRSDIGLFGGPYADMSMGSAGRMSLRLASTSGSPGDTVTIPIFAKGIVDMAGLELMIEYDVERLELLKVTTAAATRSFNLTRKNVGQSIVYVMMNRSQPIFIDSASVAELVFVIRKEAKGRAFVSFQNASLVGGVSQPLALAQTEDGLIDLIATSVKEEKGQAPADFSLSANYPNPFNPSTTIEFTLPVRAAVTLKVYDILGRECATLVNETLGQGRHRAVFNAGKLSSGIYLYRLQAGTFLSSRRMLLLK